MKKLIFSAAVFLFISVTAFAQTEKGDWLVGGNITLNTAKNNTAIGLTPNAGMFILNNLAFGGNFSIVYTNQGSAKTTNFGIGPFARYYFSTAAVRPFLQASAGFLSTKVTADSASSSTNGLNYFLGVGAAYFINENISIEAVAGYDHTKYKDFDGTSGFLLKIGFQVYLNQRQVQNVRGK